MPKEFYISLKSMIQNGEGKVLFLVKKKNGEKFLDLPGGRIEDNDNFEESIKKELNEELSLTDDIEILGQTGLVWELPSEFMKEGRRQLIITFKIKTNLDKLNLSDEHIDYMWIDLDDLADLEDNNIIMLEGYQRNLEELYCMQWQSLGKILFKENKYFYILWNNFKEDQLKIRQVYIDIALVEKPQIFDDIKNILMNLTYFNKSPLKFSSIAIFI